MTDSSAPDPLAALGALHPERGVAGKDLEAAVRDVRAAVEEGQTLRSYLGAADRGVFLPPSAGGRLSLAAAAEFGPGAFSAGHLDPELFQRAPWTAAAPRTLAAIRSAPFAEADPLASPWTRAMRPSASRGPFVNDLGERFWIDTFLLPQLVTVVAPSGPSGAPRILARLPLGRRLTSTRRRRLSAGSVWLPAQTLVPGRPSNEFVGLRIRGGSVQLDGVTSATNTQITLAGAWRLVLVLQLDPPPAPSAPLPAGGPGADAAAASVDLPPSVTLTLDASGARMIDVADSKATAYGTSFQLTRTEDSAFYDGASRSVVVPGAVSRADFPFANLRSTSWKIGDAARIARSGWALPVTVTAPDALGEAAGAGFLWVELETPLRTSWTGIPKPVTLPKSTLGLAPGWIAFWAAVKPGEITQKLRLWDESKPDPLRQSSLEAESVAGSTILYLSQPGSEAVLWSGRAAGHLDRPVQADGGRVAVRMPAAWVVLLELPAGTTATILAADPAASAAPHIAFGLENGLMKVRPPAWLYASGPLQAGQLVSGVLLVRLAYRSLLPTLPDPYAANFGFDRTRDFESGWLNATVNWPAPDAPSLAFSIQEVVGGPLLSAPAAAPVADLYSRTAPFGPERVLLDVSSNADQFGVVIPLQTPSLDVRGLALVASAREIGVVTLPPISWEPMLTRAPVPGDGDVPLPPPPHDGGPARLAVDTPEIQPVSPVPLVTAYEKAIQARQHFRARLPLPFGLIAQLNTLRQSDARPSPFLASGNRVYWNQPAFAGGMDGGLQLAIRGPANPSADAHPPVPFTDSRLPGHVEPTLDNQYAQGVLSTNLFTAFDSAFGAKSPNGIPLRHYELSGYGASLWSDWRDSKAPGPAIIEARFDVLVGRTAHEVIQMQSVLYPWFARVVRTITMDRRPGGWILREDSGWVAVTNGFFEYQPAAAEAFTPARRHPGAIVGVARVRNIRLDGPQFPIGSGPVPTIWQPVRFDAEVVFAEGASPRLTVAGGSVAGRVASRNLTGWIQIDGPKFMDPLPDGTSMQRVSPASAVAIHDLLQVKGPASAPVACGLELGGKAGDPGLAFRAVRADVTTESDAGVFHLVAAVRGSPALPRDGAWSLARRAKSDPAPSALDPSFAIPVVRPNASLPGAARWHLADPADITRLDDAADPATRYGLVQSLGTQKVFFERPRVGNDPEPITLPQPPHLADMGALLNAAGVFPGLADAFDFPSLKALSVSGGSLGFAETFPIGAPGALKKAVLVDLGGADSLQVLIEYHDENDKPTVASIEVDPAASPRWRLSLARACFAVTFKGKPLISIFAAVKADEHTAPKVEDLRVRYEGILNVLQSIFSNIEQVARFLPGGSAAGLKVGFSHGRLTVHNAFALPTLPLGAGQITDIAVEMGFDVGLSPLDVRFVAGLGSSEKPFRWIVSPLAGTGVVQVAISTNGLDILVQGGLGLGLAIDLGIASGSASIALALELNTGPDPFELKAILSGRASVDVLQGLASATITLAAGLGIIPPPQLFAPPFLPPQLLPPPSKIPSLTIGLTASVSAGIHLSICWVVDVDWDGYWQFRQDITTPEIPIPLL
ncbi:MAG: hypothetical protein LC796_09625 [Acidobacteria bacterium]|nr:hypothetical protein [Acidobacteriota bacterium]